MANLCCQEMVSLFSNKLFLIRASLVAQMVKNLPANAGDTGNEGLIPGLGKSPGEGNGNPLQYSCLENPMDRGAWQATVHGVKKSRTRLSTHAFFSLILFHVY